LFSGESGSKMTQPTTFLLHRHAHPRLNPHRRTRPKSSRLFGLWRGPTNLVCWIKIDGHPLFWDGQNWHLGQSCNPNADFLGSLTPALSCAKSSTTKTMTASLWAPSPPRAPTDGWTRHHRAASRWCTTCSATWIHPGGGSSTRTVVMIHGRRRRSPTALVLTDKVVGGGSTRVRAHVSKVMGRT
jgi:hypothetical protein